MPQTFIVTTHRDRGAPPRGLERNAILLTFAVAIKSFEALEALKNLFLISTQRANRVLALACKFLKVHNLHCVHVWQTLKLSNFVSLKFKFVQLFASFKCPSVSDLVVAQIQILEFDALFDTA